MWPMGSCFQKWRIEHYGSQATICWWKTVYRGHPFIMVIDAHTKCRAFSSGAVTTCFYDLGLSWLTCRFFASTYSLPFCFRLFRPRRQMVNFECI